MNTFRKFLGFGFILAAVLIVALPFLGKVNVFTPSPVTSVTYVYEKDDTALPSAVQGALNKLNVESDGKIDASWTDQNGQDGDDQIPDQYKIPIASAKAAGLPALVVMSGDKVIKVVKDPKTFEQVLEAAK